MLPSCPAEHAVPALPNPQSQPSQRPLGVITDIFTLMLGEACGSAQESACMLCAACSPTHRLQQLTVPNALRPVCRAARSCLAACPAGLPGPAAAARRTGGVQCGGEAVPPCVGIVKTFGHRVKRSVRCLTTSPHLPCHCRSAAAPMPSCAAARCCSTARGGPASAGRCA